MARPSKYETHVKPRLIEIEQWARDGFTELDIYTKLRIGKDAWIDYKRQHTELSDTLKSGIYADMEVEKTAYNMAVSGKFPIMTMWWLQNRQSQKWKRVQENVSTEGTGELKQFTEAIDNKAGKATPKAEL